MEQRPDMQPGTTMSISVPEVHGNGTSRLHGVTRNGTEIRSPRRAWTDRGLDKIIPIRVEATAVLSILNSFLLSPTSGSLSSGFNWTLKSGWLS